MTTHVNNISSMAQIKLDTNETVSATQSVVTLSSELTAGEIDQATRLFSNLGSTVVTQESKDAFLNNDDVEDILWAFDQGLIDAQEAWAIGAASANDNVKVAISIDKVDSTLLIDRTALIGIIKDIKAEVEYTPDLSLGTHHSNEINSAIEELDGVELEHFNPSYLRRHDPEGGHSPEAEASSTDRPVDQFAQALLNLLISSDPADLTTEARKTLVNIANNPDTSGDTLLAIANSELINDAGIALAISTNKNSPNDALQAVYHNLFIDFEKSAELKDVYSSNLTETKELVLNIALNQNATSDLLTDIGQVFTDGNKAIQMAIAMHPNTSAEELVNIAGYGDSTTALYVLLHRELGDEDKQQIANVHEELNINSQTIQYQASDDAITLLFDTQTGSVKLMGDDGDSLQVSDFQAPHLIEDHRVWKAEDSKPVLLPGTHEDYVVTHSNDTTYFHNVDAGYLYEVPNTVSCLVFSGEHHDALVNDRELSLIKFGPLAPLAYEAWAALVAVGLVVAVVVASTDLSDYSDPITVTHPNHNDVDNGNLDEHVNEDLEVGGNERPVEFEDFDERNPTFDPITVDFDAIQEHNEDFQSVSDNNQQLLTQIITSLFPAINDGGWFENQSLRINIDYTMNGFGVVQFDSGSERYVLSLSGELFRSDTVLSGANYQLNLNDIVNNVAMTIAHELTHIRQDVNWPELMDPLQPNTNQININTAEYSNIRERINSLTEIQTYIQDITSLRTIMQQAEGDYLEYLQELLRVTQLRYQAYTESSGLSQEALTAASEGDMTQALSETYGNLLAFLVSDNASELFDEDDLSDAILDIREFLNDL